MSMMSTQTPAREDATRPADQRFETLAAMYENALQDKNLSREIEYNYKDLRIVPREIGGEPSIKLASPKGEATLTNWAFKQICRSVGAPAGYVGELPTTLTAECLNYGLQNSAIGTRANLLVKAPHDGQPDPLIRACTSDQYGRLYDADWIAPVQDRLCNHDASWKLPQTWSGKPAGAYRGPEDSFLIMVNGGSIVDDPSISLSGVNTTGAGANAGAMYRGIMVRNSEVGKNALTIEEILFRAICGNHLLWGAILSRQYRRRHVGKSVGSDAIREISRMAFSWAQQSTGRDNALIRGLIDNELAHSKDAIVDELQKMGASKAQATAMYERCEATENVSPRSFWGLAQGATRASQDSPYQSDRYKLDKLAALVMARGARLVRV